MTEKKPFWQSKSFWGLAVMAVGIYAPKYSAALQGSLDDIITLIGLVVTLIGRWTATKPLTVSAGDSNAPIARLILGCAMIAAMSTAVAAQDTVKITVAFQNLNVANQNLPGGDLSVDYKLVNFGKWRLGGVADAAYQRDTGNALDRFQFLAGPQISYSFGEDRISVFGRGLFGVTRFDVRNGSTPDFTRATVGVGGGLDVHFGRAFLRPIQFDLQLIDRRPVRYTRFAAGGGFRF